MENKTEGTMLEDLPGGTAEAFDHALSLLGTQRVPVVIEPIQGGNLQLPWWRLVTVGVPTGTVYAKVNVEAVDFLFTDGDFLDAKEFARLYYEIEKGTIKDDLFKFVVIALLRNGKTAQSWKAVFDLEVLCFG